MAGWRYNDGMRIAEVTVGSERLDLVPELFVELGMVDVRCRQHNVVDFVVCIPPLRIGVKLVECVDYDFTAHAVGDD